MKKYISNKMGIAVAFCLSVLATETTFAQQGKGNANKSTPEVTEEQVPATEKRGRSEEVKHKDNREYSSSQNKPGYQKKDEDKADKRKNKDNKEWEKDKADKDNNGNAYGRDKGDMSGREFGQARAGDARLHAEQRREELEKVVDAGENKVKEAKEKIARATEDLEKNKKNRKITDAEYKEKKARIDRAERAVMELEEKVKEGRQFTQNLTY